MQNLRKILKMVTKISHTVEAVECLIYLAHVTRPDIIYAINKLSQYCNSPGNQHRLGMKMIMRYLQGTKNLKLSYVKDDSKEITR